MFRQTIHDAIRTMKSNASREEVENTLEKAFQQSTPWYKRPNPTWNHKDRDGKTPLVYAVDFCDRPSQIEVLSVILSKRFPDKKSISANQESLDEFVLAVNTAIRKKNILFFQALYDQNLLHSKTLFSALKKADSQFLAALSELAHAKESAALLRSILTEHASHKLTDEQTNKLLGVVLTKLLTEPVSTQEANAAINTIINYKTKSNYHHLLFTMTLLVRFDKLDLAAQHINSFLPSLSAELYSISRTVTPAMPDQTRTQLYFQAISLTLQNEKSTLTQCLKQCDDDTLEKLDDFFKKNTSLDPSAAELYLNAKIKACQKKMVAEPVLVMRPADQSLKGILKPGDSSKDNSSRKKKTVQITEPTPTALTPDCLAPSPPPKWTKTFHFYGSRKEPSPSTSIELESIPRTRSPTKFAP